MSKHVPPPIGEPIAGPELAPEAVYLPTPATPEEAFQAIGQLRKEARDEIDRLIGFLDKTDDYVSRELEDAVDDNPCDDLETEPSLGSLDRMADQTKWAAGNIGSDLLSLDAEQDDSDDEPSLGSGATFSSSSQAHWAQGASDEREDMNEDGDGSMANGTVDDEPSLASTASLNQEKWSDGDGNDREQGTTRRFRQEPKPASICNVVPVTGEWWKLKD
jgi:hypothetical protein